MNHYGDKNIKNLRKYDIILTIVTLLVLLSIAITDGSLSTIPFPFIVTKIFAVPKSIPISLELNDKKLILNIPS